jgi:plastocyanin
MPSAPPLVALLLLAAPLLGSAETGPGAVAGKVDVSPPRFQDETVVYLADVPGTWKPRTHAMDQRGMKFIPLVLAVTAGDTVRFLNNDGEPHNVFSPDQEAFNLGTFQSGDQRSQTFEAPGVYRIRCSIHPEMLAWVFVAPNPFAAPVDRRGRFALKDVPPGTYKLTVWNAHVEGLEKPVTVAAGKTAEETLSLRPPRR